MCKILIVEDNASFRQSLKNILHLKFPSIVIEEAADGNETLQKVDAVRPELIFMDIQLPGRDGLQLTREIKASYPNRKVIILTSHDLPEFREAAVLCGATRFITKDSLIWEEIETLIKPISSELHKNS